MVKAVVGANWGDEGKGKITDMLAREADIVIRFQGGANAGHTIVNDYGKFALHTLPSGVFYGHTTSIIGNGVALNIPVLVNEIRSITDRGVPAPKILVSDRAQVVMPYHILFDQYEEERLGGKSFGSTKSGIAPFYSDKYAKIGFQVCELFDEEGLREKLERVCATKNVLLEHLYHKPLLDVDELYNTMMEYKEMIAPYVCDTSRFLDEALKEGKNILLEGQLGTLKDPDHGIYPMVTSSSTLAAYGAIGAGIPPYEIKQVITVCKAYSSAVGAGAFVSEIFGEEADELRRRGGDGGEYGATTGRPRRMGWFDCVASRYGCRLQGTTDVAFTVLDVLGYLDEIPVCVGYEVDGEVTEEFPVTWKLEKAKPVLLLMRQEEMEEVFSAVLLCDDSLGGKAGIVAWLTNHYNMILRIERGSGGRICYSVERNVHDLSVVVASGTLPPRRSVTLSVRTDLERYHIILDGMELASALMCNFSSNATMNMNFTGTMFGIFAEEGSATFITEISSGMVKVLLREVVDAISFLTDDSQNYFDTLSGEIILVADDGYGSDEDIGKEEIESDEARFIPLPSRWDINGYRIMEDFIAGLDDQRLQSRLSSAIRGRGAFSRFRDNVARLGLLEAWYRFHEEALTEKAIQWCRENNLDWE